MEGNQGPQEELLSAIAMCGRSLEEVTLPKSSAFANAGSFPAHPTADYGR